MHIGKVIFALKLKHCNPLKIRCCFPLDCEQSLFFFRFSKGSARARAAKPRDARNEGGSHFAPSVTRVAICVSRRFARRTTEKRVTARSLVFLSITLEQEFNMVGGVVKARG